MFSWTLPQRARSFRCASRGVARAAIVLAVCTAGISCSGGDSSGPGTGGGGAPTITSLSPTSAPRGGDVFTLRITGTGFTPNTSVMWDGVVRPGIVHSETELTTFIMPSDLEVMRTVQVSVLRTDGKQSGNATFTVGPAAPVISSVSPSSVQAGSAAIAITVLGSEFTSASVVRFNGESRPTAFVSDEELTAQLTTDDLATGAVVEIVVSTPDAGASRATDFTVINPDPDVSSLSPGYVGVGAGPVTLTVTGSNFVRSSVVRWNDADRVTTFVSATELTAVIPTTDLSALATTSVSVHTPTPGGGTTSSLPFAVGISSVVTLDMKANDVLADAARGVVYASVAGTDLTRANTIAKIDPTSGTVLATVNIGSNPARMAMSDDGQFLYVGLNGTGEVAQVDLSTFTAGIKFGLGGGVSTGTLYAGDIDVMPGAPTSIAVALSEANVSPSHSGVAIFDNGVQRSVVSNERPINAMIAFTSDSNTLYGGDNQTSSNDFNILTINASGITTTDTTRGLLDGFGPGMESAGGRLYLSDGIVIEPATSTTTAAGSCTLESSVMREVRPDVSSNRVFYLSVENFQGPAPSSRIWGCDATTFGPAGSITVPGVAGGTGRLARWGVDGFAFPAADELVLVKTSLVPTP